MYGQSPLKWRDFLFFSLAPDCRDFFYFKPVIKKRIPVVSGIPRRAIFASEPEVSADTSRLRPILRSYRRCIELGARPSRRLLASSSPAASRPDISPSRSRQPLLFVTIGRVERRGSRLASRRPPAVRFDRHGRWRRFQGHLRRQRRRSRQHHERCATRRQSTPSARLPLHYMTNTPPCA